MFISKTEYRIKTVVFIYLKPVFQLKHIQEKYIFSAIEQDVQIDVQISVIQCCRNACELGIRFTKFEYVDKNRWCRKENDVSKNDYSLGKEVPVGGYKICA